MEILFLIAFILFGVLVYAQMKRIDNLERLTKAIQELTALQANKIELVTRQLSSNQEALDKALDIINDTLDIDKSQTESIMRLQDEIQAICKPSKN